MLAYDTISLYTWQHQHQNQNNTILNQILQMVTQLLHFILKDNKCQCHE